MIGRLLSAPTGGYRRPAPTHAPCDVCMYGCMTMSAARRVWAEPVITPRDLYNWRALYGAYRSCTQGTGSVVYHIVIAYPCARWLPARPGHRRSQHGIIRTRLPCVRPPMRTDDRPCAPLGPGPPLVGPLGARGTRAAVRSACQQSLAELSEPEGGLVSRLHSHRSHERNTVMCNWPEMSLFVVHRMSGVQRERPRCDVAL